MMKKSIRFKKWLSLWLAMVLCLTLAACGEDAAKDTGGDGSSTTSTHSTTGTVDTDGTTTSTTTTTISANDGSSDSGSSDDDPTNTSGSTTTTTSVSSGTPTTHPTASEADKQLVDRAFQLAQSEKIEGVTLTGVVISSQGYSEGYNNATFDLQVEGTDGYKTLYCYRVKPADSSRPAVEVGDYLSLTGTIQNYKGTIEFYPAEYTHLGSGGTTTTVARPTYDGSTTIDENGIYDSKEDVALYIHTYGKLPKNYFPKSQFNKNDRYQCCGGDRFYNKEGRLPAGEIYYECDIDTYGSTSRGAKRIVWTKSGIVYYTGDHYETFTQLYGER